MRTIKDYVLLSVKGMAMGAADVVPGVSGGTIALITGIYNELLHSIKNIGPDALVVLFKQGIPAFWRHINGSFLVAVFAGILISIKTFAAIIGYLLASYPLQVWGGFSGLIIASLIILGRQQHGWKWFHWLGCILGAVFVVFVSVAKPAQLSPELWILFLGGFVAICAMILPGISGSFILLLVGLYPEVLRAINELNIPALLAFAAGAGCGLMAFSRFLSWLLDKYYTITLATLIGFLIGSLNVTWPWKNIEATYIDRHGEVQPLVQSNVSPFSYERLTGLQSELISVVIAAIMGLALVLLVEYIGAKVKKH